MVSDLHNDILTSGKSPAGIRAYLDGALKACDILTLAAWTTGSAVCTADLKAAFSEYGGYAVGKEGRGRVVFAVEDMGFLGGQAAPGKVSEGALEDFFTLPAVYGGMVWNDENVFGGGAFSDAGLKDAGKTAVRHFNKSDIALDFAHMNGRTFYEAAALYQKPILCSHTCFIDCVPENAPFYNVARARNIDIDRQKIIAGSGGLIGLTFVASFLNGTDKCTSDDVVRHIDHFVSGFGHRNLAIGTDYFGTRELPPDIPSYSNFEILVEKLSKMGYNRAVIDDIMRGNYNRFIARLNRGG